MTTLKVGDYFGGCPHCGQSDGCTNIGRSHWYYCKAHKTKWWIGSNLFSSWVHETKDEQRRAYDEIGMGEFTLVEPLPCTDPEIVGKAEAPPDHDTEPPPWLLEPDA